MSVPDLQPLPFETDAGFGRRATLGLVVLASDRTIEMEAAMLRIDGVALHFARIANAMQVTPQTLLAMHARLPDAAALLPREFGFDAIGYGCTSAATVIGPARVAEAIHEAHPGVSTTDPISAAIAAFVALGAQRIAVVTPYTADVTAPVAKRFASAGLDVTALGSFLEASDPIVACISSASVACAVQRLSRSAACDAVFVSCTSLRLLGDVARLEADVGLPVVSSNMALFWHLLRIAGIGDALPGHGSLFERALA